MFNAREILRTTKGKLLQGPGEFTICGVSTDTRTLRKNDLFFAIRGKNFDGHDFLDQAVQKGARAVLISRKKSFLPGGAPVIFVDDTIRALGRLAAAHREKFNIPVVAITGSAGKTTTKELTAAVLSCRYHVLKNTATHNNHIGVPLTLLKLTKKHNAAVVECGTNQPGDIAWLTKIAQPTIAVLINIGEAHLERLKTPRGVLREKSAVIKYTQKLEKIVLNQDDPLLRNALRLNGTPVRRYGITQKNSFQPKNIRQTPRGLAFDIKGFPFLLKTVSLENISNALAAVSVGKLLGVSVPQSARRLAGFSFPRGRLQIYKTGGIQIIDDTYNANPVSVKSALRTLDGLRLPGRKVFVCADMLELGEKSIRLHRDIGRLIKKTSIDYVVTFGPLSKNISDEVKKQMCGILADHGRRHQQVNRFLKNYLQKGDAVLVKGSRAMRMEKIVKFLKKNKQRIAGSG